MTQRTRTPHQWFAHLGDDGRFALLADAGMSPHLARYGIAARADDGIVCASLAIDGQPFLVAAQDASFLGGSVGERHGARLAAMLRQARETQTPALLLLASGGVRLHEANPAEVALGGALRELTRTRAAGTAVLGITIGDVFGGASVLACATTRLGMLAGTRLGLSGPRVIALARGRAEVNPDDAVALDQLFGADVRAAAGVAVRLRDESPALRAWCIREAAAAEPLARAVAGDQRRLAARLEMDAAEVRGSQACASLVLHDVQARLSAANDVVDACYLCSVDAALLALPAAVRVLELSEASAGHEVSAAAERIALSQYLGHHACVLAVIRARGTDILGVVEGVGHSAAFFANALQADRLYVRPGARVIAMSLEAMARVTGMALDTIAGRIDDDPLLGQPARHLVTLGAASMLADGATVR